MSEPHSRSGLGGEEKKYHHCPCRELNPVLSARSLVSILIEIPRPLLLDIIKWNTSPSLLIYNSASHIFSLTLVIKTVFLPLRVSDPHLLFWKSVFPICPSESQWSPFALLRISVPNLPLRESVIPICSSENQCSQFAPPRVSGPHLLFWKSAFPIYPSESQWFPFLPFWTILNIGFCTKFRMF
jgi:hypothetical protein